MEQNGGNDNTDKEAEARLTLVQDAENKRGGERPDRDEGRIRIRPINVFELARRVYSSKKTSHRPLKLFRS